jgi:hypothetical protein
MRLRSTPLLLFCAACGAEQPTSNRTVAAFEVPLPTPADKAGFIDLLSRQAKAYDFHVYAESQAELQQLSYVSPITMNVAVWERNDDQVVASAMDFKDHLGRVWISFTEGKDPQQLAAFRDVLMPQIKSHWPETASLPIMPNGAIPLTADLVRTSSGYEIKPSAAYKYRSATP